MEEDTEVPTDAASLMAWLKELRENANLNQKEAAKALSTTDREIRRWENESAPGGVNLLRLLSAYGVKIIPQPPEEIPRSVNAELHALRHQMIHQTRAFDAEMAVSDEDAWRLRDAKDRVFFQACRDAITNRTWDDPQVRWQIGKQAGLAADDPEMAFRSVAQRYHDIVAWIQQQKTAEALTTMHESALSSEGQEQGAGGGHREESASIPARLQELEATVAELASAEDAQLGFRSLEAAIERLVRERKGEVPPQAGTGG